MTTALGVVQTAVVCVQASSGVQGACPAGQVESVVQAYLIAPSEAGRFDLMSEPFDSATAGQFFGFSFASTCFVYLVAWGAGMVIKAVKSA